MNDAQALIARRYAQAFMQVFGAQVTRAHYDAFIKASAYIAQHKDALALYTVAALDNQLKLKALQQVLTPFGLDLLLTPLITLLLHDKRIVLLGCVLKQLASLYQKEHALQPFVITSSHPLQDQEINQIERFLARSTGCSIVYHHKVDPHLIAGIRLQSDTLLWENSVRKRLNAVKLSLQGKENYGN